MDDCVISASGIKVWNTPEAHPLLKHTDTTHPSLLDKLTETYSRGSVRGLPRILSENSEDACTWYYFSPMLTDSEHKTEVLKRLFRQSFPEMVSPQLLDAASSSEVILWPKLPPPPSRPRREGRSEPDVLINLGDEGLVLVEAKYKSDISERTTHDDRRDQVIRMIAVGSWHARTRDLRDRDQGPSKSYVIVLQYGDAQANSEEIVARYRGKPDAIERALPYREDLARSDYARLASSLAFMRWRDPLIQ